MLMTQTTGRTAEFAEWVAHAPAANAAQTEAATAVLIDTVGVGIAGSHTSAHRLLTQWLDPGGTTGAAALWGTGIVGSPASAALANGLAGHALDWDDASPTRWLHAGTVLWPALLADVSGGVTGADLARGYSVGSTVFRAVSDILPLLDHYRRGWHNTSTSGRFAAVAAVAAARRLSADVIATAIGIVASTAAGTLANFGTMTKPLHAGLAARDALMAVELAASGFTASADILDDPRGFVGLYGEVTGSSEVDLGERLRHCWQEWTQDYAIKRYPSCYATQRAIDAALELRPSLTGGPEDIERVDVFVEPGGLLPLQLSPPTTGLEAKFSLAYTVALALTKGRVRLADFDDSALADADMADLMARIDCFETDTPPLGEPLGDAQATTLKLVERSGNERLIRVDHAHGDARNPMSLGDIVDKFVEAVPLPAGQAKAWADTLSATLSREDLSGLQRVLAGPPAE
ncbi:MAG: MmgE/PrpD family protein [Propionibacteriaceae bacterium]|nr:MmgE/PrpD family protein [Propionibacteriaceae bacterium]